MDRKEYDNLGWVQPFLSEGDNTQIPMHRNIMLKTLR